MVVIFHFIANSEGKNHITSKNNFVYFLKGWGGSLFGWDLKFWKKAVGGLTSLDTVMDMTIQF